MNSALPVTSRIRVVEDTARLPFGIEIEELVHVEISVPWEGRALRVIRGTIADDAPIHHGWCALGADRRSIRISKGQYAEELLIHFYTAPS